MTNHAILNHATVAPLLAAYAAFTRELENLINDEVSFGGMDKGCALAYAELKLSEDGQQLLDAVGDLIESGGAVRPCGRVHPVEEAIEARIRHWVNKARRARRAWRVRKNK